MSKERAACCRKGCGRKAVWHLVLLLRVPARPEVPIRAVLGACVCERCRDAIPRTVDAWLAEEGWATVCGNLLRAGYAEPAKELTTVDFAHADSHDVKVFHKMRRGDVPKLRE